MSAGNEDPHNITEIGYVVCPSSTPVPAGVEPNKTNRFTVHLARPIDTTRIRGELEVALVEVSLPHSWTASFPAERCEYQVHVANIRHPQDETVHRQACLPPNAPVRDYVNVEGLVEGLNERRPRLENIPNKIWAGKFRLSASGKVQLCLFEGESLELSPDLAMVLGFEQSRFSYEQGRPGDAKGPFAEDELKVNVSVSLPTRENEEFDTGDFDGELRDEGSGDTVLLERPAKRKRSKRRSSTGPPKNAATSSPASEQAQTRAIIPPGGRQRLKDAQRYFFTAGRKGNLHFSTTTLFIYSAIVKATPVGNVSAPLLRTVHVDPRDRGRYLNYNFQKLRYLPLTTSYVSAIDFAIHHESGEPVEFQWGRVQCTLHFRKKSQ